MLHNLPLVPSSDLLLWLTCNGAPHELAGQHEVAICHDAGDGFVSSNLASLTDRRADMPLVSLLPQEKPQDKRFGRICNNFNPAYDVQTLIDSERKPSCP